MARGVLVSMAFVMFAARATAQQPVPQPAVPQQAAPQQPLPQQAVPQPPGNAQQPPPVHVPPGFQLNQLQQAFLDNVLDAWERESAKITTFKCSFQRWEYDPAFGPQGIPLNKNLGELSYQRPDKGSFQITEIHRFQEQPVPAGQPQPQQLQGDWVKQPDAIGEHWVCDGQSVYEYRHDQKQLVERQLPPDMRGKAIADGPLPFVFGAEAKKLKARYWLRIEQQANQDPNLIWLVARPKLQEQAADFTEVEVMLDRLRLLPTAMQVHMPNRSRHMYLFDINKAKVNDRLTLLGALFQRPRVPIGWKRVVEEIPLQQAGQPGAPPR